MQNYSPMHYAYTSSLFCQKMFYIFPYFSDAANIMASLSRKKSVFGKIDFVLSRLVQS